LGASPFRAGDLIGQATVIDRDAIEIQRRIRLSPGSGSLGKFKEYRLKLWRAIRNKTSNSYIVEIAV
jgi:hypothetical protein